MTSVRIFHRSMAKVDFVISVVNIFLLTTKDTKKALRTQRNLYKTTMKIENELANKVIGAAIRVHQSLGPGLLESAYKETLYYEIGKSGLYVIKEVPMPLVYEEVHLECGYRMDLLVENRLVVELKAVDALNDVHLAQILTYLKLGNFRLGLLINFNVALLKNGIKRVIN